MSELKVCFLLPDGRSFRQFSMPGVPHKGDTVQTNRGTLTVASVEWDLRGSDIHGADVVVTLEGTMR